MTCPVPSTFNAAYLGKPGSLVKLPPPSQGIPAPLTRAGITHQLASGGSTVTRRPNARRTYTLAWNNRDLDSTNVLLAFYFGTMGNGPFAYLDPGFRNLQDTHVSSMGAALSGQVGWAATAGDAQPVYTTAVAPPFAGTAVVQWPTPVNTHNLVEGSFATTNYLPNALSRPYAVPYLPDQPFTTSIYARTASGTCSAAATALGQTAAGGAMVAAVGTTTTLTTAWQRLQVSVAVGAGGWSFATTPYISAGLRCLSGGAPTIYVAASQVEPGVLIANNWTIGVGVPRVSIADPANISYQVWARRTHGLVLVEN